MKTDKVRLFILTIALFALVLTACAGETVSLPTESVPEQDNTTQQDAAQGSSSKQDNQSVSVLEVCPTVDEFLAEIQESYTVEENKGLGGGKWSTGIKLGGDKGYISITSMADTGKIVTLMANNTKSTKSEIDAVVSRYLTYITAFMKKIPDGYHDEESSWEALTSTFTNTDTGYGMAKKVSGVELELEYNYILSRCVVVLQIDVDETYKISKGKIESYEKESGAVGDCWYVIGTFGESNWEKAFPMKEIEPDLWITETKYYIAPGDEFAFQFGEGYEPWNTIYLPTEYLGGTHYVVTEEYPGEEGKNYYIKLNVSTEEVTLEE